MRSLFRECNRYFPLTEQIFVPIICAMDLSQYREREGLTLRQLAAQIRCSASSLYRIEQGLQAPTYAMAQAIVKATGGKVKLADLFGDAA